MAEVDGRIKLGIGAEIDANQVKSEATKVGDVLNGTMTKATGAADSLWNTIKRLSTAFFKFTMPDFDASEARESVTAVKELGTAMGELGKATAWNVSESFSNTFANIIDFSNNAGESLNNTFLNAFSNIINFANNAGESLGNAFHSGGLGKVTDVIDKFFEFDKVRQVIYGVPPSVDAVNSALDSMAEKSTDVVSGNTSMSSSVNDLTQHLSRLSTIYNNLAAGADSAWSSLAAQAQQSMSQEIADYDAKIKQANADLERMKNLIGNMSDARKIFSGEIISERVSLKADLRSRYGENMAPGLNQDFTQTHVDKLNEYIAKLNEARDNLVQSLDAKASESIGQLSVKLLQLKEARAELAGMESGKLPFTDVDYQNKSVEVKMLASAVQELKASLQSDIDNKIAQAVAELEAEAKHLEELKSKGVQFIGSGAEIQSVDTALTNIEQKLAYFKSTQTEPVIDMTVTNQELADAIAKVEELEAKVKEAKAQGANESMGGFNELTAELEGARAKVAELRGGTDGTGMSFQDLAGKASQVASVIQTGVNNANNRLKQLVGLAGRAASSFMRLAKSVTVSSSEMKRGFKRGLKYLLMMVFGVRGLMFAFRKLRTAVISTIQEMAKSSSEFNDQISEFKTLLNTLKGSMGTMAQPLISAVLPAVNAIIQALTQAIIVAAKFFAVLTGQGYIMKATGAQVDYAKSLRGTGAAAKEAQKSLMGFDEINRLNAENDGGGGGGSAPDYTYEKADIDMDDAVSKFAEMIKKAWETGDFFDVGQFLANKLTEQLRKFQGWLVGPGKALFDKIATSLATLINGIVSTDLGTEIGRTIGTGFNVIMGSLDLFLTTTNWVDVGAFIANTLMGFINRCDWTLLGKLVADWIRSGIDMWYGFVTTFDFSGLGEKISSSINSFFATMGAVDPEGMTGWQKLGVSLSETVKGLLDIILTALEEIDWEQVGIAIGEFLASIDWKGIWERLKGILRESFGGLGEILDGLFEANPKAGIVGTILLIIGIIGKLAGVVVKLIPIIGTILSSEMFGIIAGGIGIVLGAVVAIGAFIAQWKNGISTFKMVVMWIGIIVAAIGAFLAGGWVAALVALIVGLVMTIVLVIKEHWNEIIEWWEGVMVAIGGWFVDLFDTINYFKGLVIQTIVDWVTEIWDKISSWWTDKVVPWFEGIPDWVAEKWESLKTKTSEKWEAVKTTIATIIENIKNKISTVLTTIVGYFSQKWNTIKTNVSEKFGAVRDFIHDTIDGIKEFWDETWNTLSDTVDEVFTGIGETAVSGVNGLIDAMNGLLSFMADAANGLIDILNMISFDMPDALGGGHVGFSISHVTAAQIPYLAKGAVLPPNQPFAAIVGDQKHGTNVEAPLDTIKLAVAEEMKDVVAVIEGGFNALIQTVENKDMDVHIGDKAIGQAANRYNNRMNIVRGTT